jgi:hypothetical protein
VPPNEVDDENVEAGNGMCCPLLGEAEEEEPEEEEPEDGISWHDGLSHTSRRLIHLARAFIFCPQVLVLDMPLEGLSQDEIKIFLMLLREFVDKRGLEKEQQYQEKRLLRTVFMSVGAMHETQASEVADDVWSLSLDGLDVHRDSSQTASSQAKVVRTWTSIPEDTVAEFRSSGHALPVSSIRRSVGKLNDQGDVSDPAKDRSKSVWVAL